VVRILVSWVTYWEWAEIAAGGEGTRRPRIRVPSRVVWYMGWGLS